MKNIVLSAVAVLAMSSFAVAGGDIAPVEEPMVVVEPVITDGGFYLGLGYGFLNATQSTTAFYGDTEVTNTSIDDSFGEIMIDAGYKFNSYVAIEGRYWFGVSDNAWLGQDNFNIPNGSVDVDAWGIYLKPMYPVTDAFDIYALLGYGGADLDIDLGNFEYESPSYDGFSWGLGAAYSFSDSVSLFVDYTNIYDNDDRIENYNGTGVAIDEDTTLDIWTFGVNYQF